MVVLNFDGEPRSSAIWQRWERVGAASDSGYNGEGQSDEKRQQLFELRHANNCVSMHIEAVLEGGGSLASSCVTYLPPPL